MFKPSQYQQAIFDKVKNTDDNIIINAVAGSGKTTTLLELLELIPKNKSAIFLAFNKSIVTDIGNKLSERKLNNIKAYTYHSFGLSLFRYNLISTNFIKDKTDEIIDDTNDDNEDFNFLKNTIFLIKNNNIDYENFEELTEYINTLDYEGMKNTKEITELIQKILSLCEQEISSVDFDDMIWLPVRKHLLFKSFDYILVDEAQDLNKMQFDFTKKLVQNGTRIIAVGDRNQSIYAFRGADTNSMANFQKVFNMFEMPLSISYRCPLSVIKLAQDIVPEIEAQPLAIEGEVSEVEFNEILERADNSDFIINRTNAPLVYTAYELLKMGKNVIIRGRDIGKSLIANINGYKVHDIKQLIIKNKNRLNHLNDKLISEKNMKKRVSILNNIDNCEVLNIMGEMEISILGLINKINSIFSDDMTNKIICSSVHKAKGLEADNVFILNYSLFDYFININKGEDKQQEKNIKYVAITRAKEKLFLGKAIKTNK